VDSQPGLDSGPGLHKQIQGPSLGPRHARDQHRIARRAQSRSHVREKAPQERHRRAAGNNRRAKHLYHGTELARPDGHHRPRRFITSRRITQFPHHDARPIKAWLQAAAHRYQVSREQQLGE
jgi:hypothetical protein